MPQLIPAPWWAYLLCSWVVIAKVTIPKVLARVLPNCLTSKIKQHKPAVPWHWPWY